MNRRHSQAGGALTGVLIALLALLAIAVAGIVAGGWYLAHNVRVRETRSGGGKTVAVQTPIGSIRVQEQARLDPAQAGLPVYPGARAEEVDSKSVSLELDFGSEHKELTIVAAEYATDDAVEKVVEFYRKELPHWIVSKRQGRVRMEYSEKGHRRFIAISEKRGHTCIALAQVGEPPTI